MTAIFKQNEPWIWLIFHAKENFESTFIIILTSFDSADFRAFFTAHPNTIMTAFKFFRTRLFTRFPIAFFPALLGALCVFTSKLTRFNTLFTWLTTVLRTQRMGTTYGALLSARWTLLVTAETFAIMITNIAPSTLLFAFSMEQFPFTFNAFERALMSAF